MLAPAQIRALVTADLAIVTSQEYHTPVGRLFLASKIASEQWAAAKKWDAVATAYREAIHAPPPSPRAQVLHAPRAFAPDADSAKGRKRARSDLRAMEAFAEVRDLIISTFGIRTLETIQEVCEGPGRTTTGFDDLVRLKAGLAYLAAWWELTESTNRVKNSLQKRTRESGKK